MGLRGRLPPASGGFLGTFWDFLASYGASRAVASCLRRLFWHFLGFFQRVIALRGGCLLPPAAFFALVGRFLAFLGCNKHEKHGLEPPSTIKITLKGFEWSNFQLKTRKASLILIG